MKVIQDIKELMGRKELMKGVAGGSVTTLGLIGLYTLATKYGYTNFNSLNLTDKIKIPQMKIFSQDPKTTIL